MRHIREWNHIVDKMWNDVSDSFFENSGCSLEDIGYEDWNKHRTEMEQQVIAEYFGVT